MPKTFLTIQTSLHGDGIVPESKEPALHVYCWDEACDFDSDEKWYMGFPLADDPGELAIEDDRCLYWYKDNAAPWLDRWCFSIRLAALTSPANLKSLAVIPSFKLLEGRSVLEALPDELFDKGLFKYSDHAALFRVTK